MKNQSEIIKLLGSIRYPDDTCKMLLRFRTQDGRILKKAVDTTTFDDAKLLQKKLRSFLCDLAGAKADMELTSFEEVIRSVQQQKVRKMKSAVFQRGWQEDLAFVGPTGILGPHKSRYFLDPEILGGSNVQPYGSLEAWQAGVLSAMRMSPTLTVCIGMALATPLMKFLGSNTNRLIILVGPSSSGKTTVEQVLMSLNASPDSGKLVTFNMSAVALTNYMSKFCDTPTIVDELGTLSKKGVAAQDKVLGVVYDVSSQAGRLRHEKAGYAPEVARTLVFTSSEGVVHYEKGGQRVRMLNIPAVEEKGCGIFTSKVVDVAAASKQHAKLIKTVESNYAHVGPAFISYVMEEISRLGQEEFQSSLRRRAKRVLAELGVGTEFADKRAAEPFAWAIVALRMAVKAGLFPGIQDDWVLRSIRKMYSRSCRLMDEDVEQRRLLMVKLAKKVVADVSQNSEGKFAWLSEGDYFMRPKKVRAWLKNKAPNQVVFSKVMEDLELLAGKSKSKKWTLTRGFLGGRSRFMAIPEKAILSYTSPLKSPKSGKSAKKRQK